MDFTFSDEQKLLKQNARNFMEREIIPIADELDRQGPLPRDLTQELLRKLIPLGYLDGPLPQEYGGQGLGLVSWGVLLEELSRAWVSLAGIVMIQELGTLMLTDFGNEEHRARYMAPLLSAEKIYCSALTEPDAGSNLAGLKTAAVADGDDFIINGTKSWCSNGTVADLCGALAITDKSRGPKGTSFILVDKEMSPYSVRALHKLGLNAWQTAELHFEDCRVPRQNLMGGAGEGYRRTLIAFQGARAFLAVMSTGIAQAALDAAEKYAQERYQFQRPIGTFQLVQEMIYEMIVETQASRLLSYRALELVAKGERCPLEASMAKAYATEAAVRVASHAVQVHGAYGLSPDSPVERYFRDARSMTIPDGTTQIQKLIVGREALGVSAIV